MKKIVLKAKKFIKRKNNPIIAIGVILSVLPILVGAIYAIPCKQIINVDSGDLLSFYGTACGIFSSFIMYRFEQDKKEKERNREIRPRLTLQFEKLDEAGKFKAKLTNMGNTVLQHIYINETRISEALYSEKSIEKEVVLNEIELKSGYPESVPVNCEDIDGDFWCFLFVQINDMGQIYYSIDDYGIV